MKEEIQICARILEAGGTLLYPTDTIWGIGCDATRPEIVSKITRIKQREDSGSMLVLVDSVEMLSRFVEQIPEAALKILEVSVEPLTIIYPLGRGLAENLLGEDGSIGIRITREPFSRELVKAFCKPVVSSSANLAGQLPPSNFAEVSPAIRSAVDHITAWRQEDKKKGRPSGILKVSLNGEIKIIRR